MGKLVRGAGLALMVIGLVASVCAAAAATRPEPTNKIGGYTDTALIPTYPDGMCAALYGQKPPDVNASRPPGTWQSFDIHFKAPVFEGRKLVQPAYVTLHHNNVLVHDNAAFLGPAVWRKLARYTPHGPAGPISLQAHGSPLRFRNIWVRPLGRKLGPAAQGG